jgi:iron complex outermembrane receptor protein
LSAQPAVAHSPSAEPAAAPSSPAARIYDIPAGALDATLTRIARESGRVIAFDPALVRGRRTPALQGSFTPEQAVSFVLQGSDLELAVAADGTLGIRRASSESTLPPVTVLGTRSPDVPMSNVPASISLMTREDIDREQATAPRIEDAISRAVPGFNPTNNGVRQIRGRTAQVFVNGVPLNEQLRASSAADLNLLAPDQLESIEVARGANSAYGFGSPGGVLALTTPRAESETLALKTKLGTSWNTSHTGGSQQTSLYQSAAQIVGAFDYHAGLALRRDGLTYDPDGNPSLDFGSALRQSNNKEDFRDLDFSLGYKLGAGTLRLTSTAGEADVREAYDSDFLGTYRATQSSLVRTPAADQNSRRYHTWNLSYENPRVGDSALKLEALASRVRTLAYDFDGTNTFRDDQTNEYQGVRSSVTTPLDALYQGATVAYGFDFLRNRYFRPYVNDDTGAVEQYFAPDVTLDTMAPYVQGQMPLGKLRLSAGVRHERYSGQVETGTSNSGTGDIQGGDIKSFDLTLFNVGAVYTLQQDRELYASFSQGAEISQLGRAARNAGTAANVDPQPAKSNQYEIGLRHRTQPIGYTLAAFYTESDLLSALQCDGINPCTPLREPREIWGIEGTLKWRLAERWNTGGTLSWADGVRTTETGEERRVGSRDVPPLLISGYVDYSPTTDWRNRLQLDYRGSRDPFGDSTEFGEGRIDSLLLTHLLTSVQVAGGELQLGIRNLFDKKYFSIPVQADNAGWYWIPEQGRRVSVSYQTTW